MEETYRTKAVVLTRQPFGEDGLNVTIYSQKKGKQTLVARGAKKIKSKLAPHIEPICLSEVMVVRGRQFNYIGSALSKNCYADLKSDLSKLEAAGQAIRIFNKLIKENEKDKENFNLLVDFLSLLNENNKVVNSQLLKDFFLLKLLTQSGYKPELYICSSCEMKIRPSSSKLDLGKGSLSCLSCCDRKALTITDDCIKVLRIIIEFDLEKLVKLTINNKLEKEINKIISSLLEYSLNS